MSESTETMMRWAISQAIQSGTGLVLLGATGMDKPTFTCTACGVRAVRAFYRLGDWTWRCYCDDHGLGDTSNFPAFYIDLRGCTTYDEAAEKIDGAMHCPLQFDVLVVGKEKLLELLNYLAEDPGEGMDM